MQIFNLFPIYVFWVSIFFVFLVVFALLYEKKLWKYQVSFPLTDHVGCAKFEIKCLKKHGTIIKLKAELDEKLRGRPIDIEIAGRLIYTIPAAQTKAAKISHDAVINIQKPDEGDLVVLRVKGNPIHSGHLAAA